MDSNLIQKNQAKNPIPKDSEFSRKSNIMDAMEREFSQIFCTEESLGLTEGLQNGREDASKPKF